MMPWRISWKADPIGRALADRHYNRQKHGAPQFVPPGRSLVLVTPAADALWITSWPFGEYVRHRWPGAWVCSAFRREGGALASDLIVAAVAATRWKWPTPPLGMVTFVDASKVKRKRDPGRCFIRAGFLPANECDEHALDPAAPSCAKCRGETEGGLLAFRLHPEAMPAAEAPLDAQGDLFKGSP